MPLHAPLPPTSPQPPEEPPLPDEDEDLSSKESEYESSDEEDRQRFVMWHICSKNKNVEKKDMLFLYFIHKYVFKIRMHWIVSQTSPRSWTYI